MIYFINYCFIKKQYDNMISLSYTCGHQIIDKNDKTTENNEINEALISAAKYFGPLFIVFEPAIFRLFAASK